MNVYFRNLEDNKLGVIQVSDVTDHEEARLLVKEQLVASGEGYNEPVLALIKGGKE